MARSRTRRGPGRGPHLVVLQQVRIDEHTQICFVTDGRHANFGFGNPSSSIGLPVKVATPPLPSRANRSVAETVRPKPWEDSRFRQHMLTLSPAVGSVWSWTSSHRPANTALQMTTCSTPFEIIGGLLNPMTLTSPCSSAQRKAVIRSRSASSSMTMVSRLSMRCGHDRSS